MTFKLLNFKVRYKFTNIENRFFPYIFIVFFVFLSLFNEI